MVITSGGSGGPWGSPLNSRYLGLVSAGPHPGRGARRTPSHKLCRRPNGAAASSWSPVGFPYPSCSLPIVLCPLTEAARLRHVPPPPRGAMGFNGSEGTQGENSHRKTPGRSTRRPPSPTGPGRQASGGTGTGQPRQLTPARASTPHSGAVVPPASLWMWVPRRAGLPGPPQASPRRVRGGPSSAPPWFLPGGGPVWAPLRNPRGSDLWHRWESSEPAPLAWGAV